MMTTAFILLLITNVIYLVRSFIGDNELDKAKLLYSKVLKEMTAVLDQVNAQSELSNTNLAKLQQLREEMDAKVRYLALREQPQIEVGFIKDATQPKAWNASP